MRAIKFYLTLIWFNHLREQVNRQYQKALKKANPRDHEEVFHEHKWEFDIAEHAIRSLQTRYYTDVARRKGVPIPHDVTHWEENMNELGTRIMTVDAIARLRSAIRQEKKELRDVWLPIMSLIVSFIALGIAALNYRKPSAQPFIQLVQPPQQSTAAAKQSVVPISKRSHKTKQAAK
jgi:hypothetical protein